MRSKLPASFLTPLLLIIITVIIIALIVCPILFYVNQFGVKPSKDQSDWGSFSDFMGFFVGLANLIVTLFIGFIIYRFQRIDAKNNEAEAKREMYESKVIHFAALMRESFNDLNRLIENLKSYSRALVEGKGMITAPSVKQSSELMLIVERLDREAYYTAIHEIVHVESIYELISQFDVLLSNWSYYAIALGRFKKKERKLLNKHRKYSANVVNELMILSSQLIKENKQLSPNYKMMKEILDNFDVLVEKESMEIMMYEEVLYDPIRAYFRANSTRLTERYFDLLEMVNDAKKTHQDIRLLRDAFAINTTTFTDRLAPQIQRTKTPAQPILNIADQLRKARSRQ